MKKILLAVTAVCFGMATWAQTDSTTKENKTEKADTIKIGGVIIIRKNGKNDTTGKSVVISNHKKKENSKSSTNWWIVDLGFANYNDNTNYASAAAQSFAPGLTEDNLKLRTGKSVNVNLWLFMQRLRIVKGINLKYGLGLELNNYRFDDERIHFQENPTLITLDPAYKGLKKNKLAADYVTVPLMLNFNLTPGRKQGFGFSAGVSGGYLYASRQKIKNGDDSKLRDDFDLRKWKVSYIGELNLGPVRLYGSYALKSMWEKGLDQTPYAVGIRLSHF
jgi:hypothetical protein